MEHSDPSMWPLTKNSRKPSAFTLIETMVTLAIFSLASVLVFALFSLGTRWLLKGEERSESYRPVLALGREIKRLSGSSFQHGATVVFPPGAGEIAFSFPVIQADDGTVQVEPLSGEPRFQAYEVYYRTSGGLVRHHRVPLAISTSPQPMSTADLLNVVQSGLGRDVLQDCSSLSLQDPGSGTALFSMAKITQLDIQVETAKGERASFTTLLRFAK